MRAHALSIGSGTSRRIDQDTAPGIYAVAASRDDAGTLEKLEAIETPDRDTLLRGLTIAIETGARQAARHVMSRIGQLSEKDEARGLEPGTTPKRILDQVLRGRPGNLAMTMMILESMGDLEPSKRARIRAGAHGPVASEALAANTLGHRSDQPMVRMDRWDAGEALQAIARHLHNAMRCGERGEEVTARIEMDRAHQGITEIRNAQGAKQVLKLKDGHAARTRIGRIARAAVSWMKNQGHDVDDESANMLNEAAMLDRSPPGHELCMGADAIEKIVDEWERGQDRADERRIWAELARNADPQARSCIAEATRAIRAEYETGRMSPDRARKMLTRAAQGLRREAETAPVRMLIEHVSQREEQCRGQRLGSTSHEHDPEVRALEKHRLGHDPGATWDEQLRYWQQLRHELEGAIANRRKRLEEGIGLLDPIDRAAARNAIGSLDARSIIAREALTSGVTPHGVWIARRVSYHTAMAHVPARPMRGEEMGIRLTRAREHMKREHDRSIGESRARTGMER